jgi:hypothetical protein
MFQTTHRTNLLGGPRYLFPAKRYKVAMLLKTTLKVISADQNVIWARLSQGRPMLQVRMDGITVVEAIQTDSDAHSIDAGGNAGQLTFKVEEISPSEARAYLASALSRRKPDGRTVSTYAAMMKAGAWVVNGQPIIFDSSGSLLDGMQRLSACVKSGVALTTLVARGVRRDTLHSIDQHRARSYVAVLEARGTYRRPASIVRLMGKLIRIENGTLGVSAPPISWARYDRVLEANPELIEAVDIADKYRGMKVHSQPLAVLAFMAIRSGHGSAFRDFLVSLDMEDDQAATGFNGATNLLSTLEAIRAVGEVGADQVLALSILAFNDWLDGFQRRKVYKWVPVLRSDGNVNEGATPWGSTCSPPKAPANLGLPVMKNYPGLREGLITDSMNGAPVEARLIHELRHTAKHSSNGISVQMVQVTPDLARRWLCEFNRGNRRVQPTQVDAIARDIQAGRWMVNAQPICFTRDPFEPSVTSVSTRLLNGQHRLHGVVKANMPIEVPVAAGLEAAVFSTYDTHTRRAAILKGAPQADLRVIAGAARFQWRVDRGLLPNDRAVPSASELNETLEKHPGLVEWFPMSRKRQVVEFGSSGIMTFLQYYLRNMNRSIAAEYFHDLFSGENLTRDNPVLHLRDKIRKLRNLDGKQRGARRDVLTIHLYGWDAYRSWHESVHRAEESKKDPSAW